MSRAAGLAVALCCALVAGAWGEDPRTPDQVVAAATTLAEEHRYREAVELLEPLAGAAEGDARLGFSVAAELGRSYFHLGRYEQAQEHLDRAAALHPESIEVGIYRCASAYLTGRRSLSFALFREILRAGARDLFMPVVLPGERQFLAEPRVWELLAEHEVDLPVSLSEGAVMGVRLGMERAEVVRLLAAKDPRPDRPVLSANAGPRTLWAFRFGDDARLEEVVLNADHLLRYTPYRLRFACGLDWSASPEAAVMRLGLPTALSGGKGSAVMTWDRGSVSASLVFGPVAEPRPLPVRHTDRALLTVLLKRVEDPGETPPQ